MRRAALAGLLAAVAVIASVPRAVLAQQPGVRESTYVPNLRGRTAQEVARMLAEFHLGLGNQATDYSDDVPSGQVFRQQPGASRTPVPTGTKVDVWYSAGPRSVVTTIPAPSVVGLTLTNAALVLQRMKLRVGHVDTTFVRGASGTVVSQRPGAGSPVHPGDTVGVTLAVPTQTVTVPLIVGLSRDSARARLRSVGLDLGRIRLVSVQGRDTVVITQSPIAGSQVNPGTLVSIVQNQLPVRRQVQVPDLRGMTREMADSLLRQDSLVLVASFANNFPSPVVVAQNPPAGQAVYAMSAVAVTFGGTAPTTLVPPTQTPPTQTPPTQTPPTQTPPTPTPPAVTPPSTSVQPSRPDSTGKIAPANPAETSATTPTLVGRSEGDAHAEAARHDLVMNVQARRRALRWSNKVVQQTPRPLAPVPADRTIEVDLEVPIVPPVPTAIVLIAGAAAVGVRQKTKSSGSHKLGYYTEAHAPGLPKLDGDPSSLIRTSIRLAYDPGAEPWKLLPSDESLIKKQERRDA